MVMPSRTIKTKKTKVVSFRIANDVFRALESYAQTRKNQMGHPMSASEAARDLFQRVLREAIISSNDNVEKGAG